jgi:hypothetical protein
LPDGYWAAFFVTACSAKAGVFAEKRKYTEERSKNQALYILNISGYSKRIGKINCV